MPGREAWERYLARQDAITEENWAEYQAKGFRVLDIPPVDPNDKKALAEAEGEAGYWFGQFYTGHAYDRDAGRPLNHKPGVSIYVSPEGLQHYGQRLVEYPEELSQPDRDIGPGII